MEQDTTGSTPLFAVFLLSLYSLFLIPYSLSLLFGGQDEEKEVVKTWSSKKQGRSSNGGFVQAVTAKVRQTLTLRFILMWTFWFLLVWYIQAAGKPGQHFDPFEILEISETATEQEIKKAYRKLSLIYHPDKNPDPAAADYFANSITKAYKALTDEVSRENYKKYGHPDGPQAMTISVALPEWFFSKEKEMAPVILLSLLFGGIVLPMGLAACYISKSNNFVGPNEVLKETVGRYAHPRFGVKSSQGVGKMPDTFIWAQEYQDIPIVAEQKGDLDELRKALIITHPELRDKNNAFYKRLPPFIKAHMLLLAHLEREKVGITLQKDLNFILEKAPRLMQELFTIASYPRIKDVWGWLTPTIAVVELMQCLVQAVSVDEKKKGLIGKNADTSSPLMQLPHFNADVIKKLVKRKVKGLPDLQALEPSERRTLLQICGLTAIEADEVETMMSALPSIFITAQLVPEAMQGSDAPPTNTSSSSSGDTAVVAAPSEIVTVRCQVMLTRPSHMAPGFDPDTVKGTVARAYTPRYPFPRDEHWFFIIGDVSKNVLLGWTRLPLLQAEAIGAKYAANFVSKNTQTAVSKIETKANRSSAANEGSGVLLSGTKFDPFVMAAAAAAAGDQGAAAAAAADSLDASLEELGQTVEIKFVAPLETGKHDLTLFVMPDSWLGADKALPMKLRVSSERLQQIMAAQQAQQQSRAALKQAKSKRGASKQAKQQKAAAAVPLQRSEESEQMLAQEGDDGDEEVSDGRDYSDDDAEYDDEEIEEDEDDDSEGEREYDSDEYGTEESGDEEDNEN